MIKTRLPHADARQEAELADLADAWGPRYARRSRSMPRDERVDFIPGLPCDSWEAFRFRSLSVERLRARLPAAEVDGGVMLSPGTLPGWERCLTTAGYSMNPAGVPAGLQDETVVPEFLSDQDEALYRYVAQELNGYAKPVSLLIKHDASSGHPAYYRAPEGEDALSRRAARDDFERGFRALTEPAFQRMWEGSDFRLAALVLGVYLCTAKATRAQPDSGLFDAVRRVFTPKVRRVVNVFGEWVDSDKRLSLGRPGPLADIEREFMAVRARSRTAHMVPRPINSALSAAFAPLRYGGYERFPSLLGYGNVAQEDAAMGAEYADHPFWLTFDVHLFDQHTPRAFVHAFIDEAPVTPTVQRVLRLLAHAPAHITSDVLGVRGAFWTGSPLDEADFTQIYGNPSGWHPNDVLNRTNGVFIAIKAMMLAGFWRWSPDWRRDVDDILHNRHARCPRLKNRGDDTRQNFRTREDLERMREALRAASETKPYVLYYRALAEEHSAYLGTTPVWGTDTAGHARVRVVPNLRSYAEKLLTPEYSAGSRQRPFASFGAKLRRGHYEQHPAFPVLDALLNETAREALGSTLIELWDRTMVVPPSGPDATDADLMYMEDPQSVYYRVSWTDVDPRLLGAHYAAIPTAVAWRFYSSQLLDSRRVRVLESPDDTDAAARRIPLE